MGPITPPMIDVFVTQLNINSPNKAKLLILSSRISYELVQKAARAHIPVILAMSRPTALAVALADRLGITLASLSKTSGLVIFCGKNRLLR